MAKFAVILAAAGRSSRFGDSLRKKPFVDLKGKAVWLRSIEPFAAHPDVEQVIIVVSPDDLEWFKETFRTELTSFDVQVVAGGAERADSVQNALMVIKPEIDFVAVHDAARPLITKDWVDKVFKAAEQTGAAIPASPIRGTIKRVVNDSITETVPREGLWEAQTPQVFRKELLIEAYAKRDGFIATDEAQLVERLGSAVSVVECSAMNMKITTQDDLRIAEALLDLLTKN
ncbi:MAG: 2-C-methyl-D-erythritol 4-phosphate cytidylyltransferase [Planctomicrobium sp.]|jgi:2-C-methyl-D-erythritol 4-phosphate cytidylyltransferase|nr:2-C-methyl-D-erythritol 4-phosphate cytidylyltransferase [Planctomicrobium sp.]